MLSMKHLIRTIRSKEYFNHGRWTRDAKEAQDFRSPETAIVVAIQCGLSNVELVLQPGDDPSEMDDICSALVAERVLPSGPRTQQQI